MITVGNKKNCKAIDKYGFAISNNLSSIINLLNISELN